LLQLLAILDLFLFDLSQTVLIFRHDQIEGKLILLSRHTDHLNLRVFVVVQLSLALDKLHTFRLGASQRIEVALAGGLLISELIVPVSIDLSRVHHDQFRVGGDGALRYGLLQFAVRLLSHMIIDLLTALIRLLLEVASADVGVRASLCGLDEALLSLVRLIVGLVDDDGGGDFSGFLILAKLILILILTLLQSLLQGGVSLLVLLLVQVRSSDGLKLAFRIATCSLLQSGQCQLERGW